MERAAILKKLWEAYILQNPSVKVIYNSFINAGETVVNDHIALRTFDDERVNIDVLAQPFIKAGYVEVGNYYFENKKLQAKHYEVIDHPDESKLFISQLMVNEFSSSFQESVKKLLDSVDQENYKNEALIYKGNIWGKPSYAQYNLFKKESEYAAWLYVFGFCANHFTVKINALKSLNTIEKVNHHIKNLGFNMNDIGGEIKGSVGELLQQSSTRAEEIQVSFIEGEYLIPACYYEFAIRYKDAAGNYFNGFIAQSADKIFESTDNSNPSKNNDN